MGLIGYLKDNTIIKQSHMSSPPTRIFQDTSGSQFKALVAPLQHLTGYAYTQHLAHVVERLGQTTREERHHPHPTDSPPSDSTDFQEFCQDFGDQLLGSHLLSHGQELTATTLSVLRQHSSQLDNCLSKSDRCPPPKILHDFIESMVSTPLTVTGGEFQVVRGDVGGYRKAATPGYDKPYNLRLISTVPGMSCPKRAVRVSPENARLTWRHGTRAIGCNDMALEVVDTDLVVDLEYHNTVVITYWVYFPLEGGNSKQPFWTFGTGYVGDTFPREKPSLIALLSDVMKSPCAHLKNSPHSMERIQGLVGELMDDELMYALQPLCKVASNG